MRYTGSTQVAFYDRIRLSLGHRQATFRVLICAGRILHGLRREHGLWHGRMNLYLFFGFVVHSAEMRAAALKSSRSILPTAAQSWFPAMMTSVRSRSLRMHSFGLGP